MPLSYDFGISSSKNSLFEGVLRRSRSERSISGKEDIVCSKVIGVKIEMGEVVRDRSNIIRSLDPVGFVFHTADSDPEPPAPTCL